MADKLIFPIGFDLEKAVKDAEKEGDKALKNLQQIFTRQPLVLKTDTSGFAELMQDTDTLKARLKEVAAQFNQMPTNIKFNLDSEGKVKQLSADGKALWDELVRINTALQGVSMSATQLLRQNQREMEAEQKAEQKRQQAMSASLRAEYKRIEAKKQAEAASRRELEMLNRQYAAEERRQRLAASQASIAKRQQILNTLRAEENTIVNITAKLQHWQKVMNSSAMDGKQFKRAAGEVQRLSEKLSEAQAKVSALTGATTTAATRQKAALGQVTNEYRDQSSYIERLIKRMALYASIGMVGKFLSNVREVTAQFELQRVSLGAIIQDQQKANQLFSEIKAFALKSPVSILDLTKYTKQLAAYKIGVDELFETTKKLTDVSVGLGVSMDRVVLAYGQVRAAGVLRASEIRQFTEMGVPIVEELASKLSKMNGELVTASQVMDMVSKRAISFELVKEVFDDMTSAGGIFYNMQEKQGNTLYGMWAKMGDAASVMYDQIGNTDIVNYAMKETIKIITDLMKHWRFWGKLLMWGGGLYLANVIAMKALRAATVSYTAAGIQNANAMKANVVAAQKVVVATKSAGTWTRWSANLSLAHAKAQYAAATATNVFKASLYSLWAAFLSNPLGWVILAVTTLVALFADADDSAKQFAQSISEIEEKYTLKSLNDADNFKRLADAALKAAEGSKEQRDKLEELDRTYGQIVGSENLQIDKLREMNGEYQSLIDTIEEYNIKMKYSEREGAIKEFYGGKKKEAFADFEDELSTIGFGSDELGHEAGAAIAINVQNALLEELEKNGKATTETARKILKKQISNTFKSRGMGEDEAEQWAETIIMRLESETKDFVETLNSERAAIEENSRNAEEAGGKLAKIYGDIKRAKEELAKVNYVNSEGNALDTNSFLFQQSVANETMKKAADLIRNSQEMKDALGDKAKELEPMWLHLVDSVSEDDLMNITTINFDAILKIIGDKYPDLKRRILAIQKEWGNIAPTNETALQIRQKLFELSNSFDPTLQKMKRFLWDGSGAVDDYLKRLKEQQEELKARLKEKQTTLLHSSKLSLWWNKLMGKDISAEIKELENEIAALDKLIPYVTEYTNPKEKSKKSTGSKSDPRLQTLQEIANKMAEVNKEYDELLKKEGQTRALADTQKLFAESFKHMQSVANKYKFKLPAFEVPKTIEDVRKWYDAIIDNIKRLNLKNADKVLIELGFKRDKAAIDKQQKDIEAELKKLSDRISRTKTAKEFYDKILSTTGDYDLAANISMSIYGDNGAELQQQMAQQIQEMFSGYDVEVPVSVIGADNQIDYLALEKFVDEMQDKLGDVESKTYQELKKIAQEGQKNLAKTYEGYLKDLEKAKSYSDKRIELARYTANKIAEIEASKYPKAEKERMTAEYKEREDKEAAKLEYEAFKNTPMYIALFDDLENSTVSSLTAMREQLVKMKTEWKNLDPTQLKELQSRLNEIDAELANKSPFKVIADGWRTMGEMAKKYGSRSKLDELIDGKRKELDALNAELEIALADEAAKKAAAEAVGATGAKTDNSVQKAAWNDYRQAADTVGTLGERIKKADGEQQQLTTDANAWSTAMGKVKKGLQTVIKIGRELLSAAEAGKDFAEALGMSEDGLELFQDINNVIGKTLDFADSLIGCIDMMGKATASSISTVERASVILTVISAALQVATAIFNLFSNSKVRKANKEIERQQELLDQLEYTYNRLQTASDKLFGIDYISNYNQQMGNLQAQAEAYRKQAEAERSKGKKADDDKIKQYEEAYRDTLDKIKDMEDDLTSKFLGTDRASAAREFAKAWLEAKASFASTTDAIKSKYKELMQSMIVESFAAKVIDSILKDVWDNVNGLLEAGKTEEAAENLANNMEGALSSMDNALNVLYESLKKKGIDVKDTFGDGDTGFTGIKRDIATASEESINGLAQGITTQNFYIGQIHGDVAMIAQRLAEGINPFQTEEGSKMLDLVTLQNQHLSQLPIIAANTAATAERCERAAKACEEISVRLSRVIRPRNVKSDFVINTQ